MRDRELQIGLFGTFDVQNYGDLLFPLIAEAELTERLGRVKVHRFSYHAKSPPGWPFAVTSVTELPRMAGDLDGVLIGGGLVVRFDKEVAPGYGPPTSAIHHPTGYWLTPALISLQHGIPLIWNAPGAHGWDRTEIPDWADPLMRLALAHSRYIAVRDEPSRVALEPFVDQERITLMPDTAFGVSRLIRPGQPSAEFKRLREESGLQSPYIVIQTVRGLDHFLSFVRRHSELLKDFQFLALPISPDLGDHEAILGADLPGLVRLSGWPHPLLLAELISQATAVVGRSYHLEITALAFGVPVFNSADIAVGRFAALSDLGAIHSLPDETDPRWFMTRLKQTPPTPAMNDTVDQLCKHWDRIAALIEDGPTNTQSAVSDFLQSLPSLLEAGALARAEVRERDERISSLVNSPSWNATAPARFVMRKLKQLIRNEGR